MQRYGLAPRIVGIILLRVPLTMTAFGALSGLSSALANT